MKTKTNVKAGGLTLGLGIVIGIGLVLGGGGCGGCHPKKC